jgi:MFS family permease
MAGLSRPFSGKLTDTVGRMPVMIFGTLVCVVCSLLYPVLGTIGGFLLLRFFHGFSTGFKPTASTAYIADIVPDNRRGEALGISGVSMNIGASMAPPFGSWVAQVWSLETMFYISSGVALLSVLMLLGLKETLPKNEKVPFRWNLLRIRWHEVYDKSALSPAFVCMFVYLGFGVMLTIVPDQSEYLGINNKGMFFAFVTFSSVLSRLVAGRISDKIGRIPIIKIGIFLLCLSLIMIGYADTSFWFFAGASGLGFSTGVAAPALFAWTIDRALPQFRGRALATIYIALEIGIGMGAFFSALIYDNNPSNFAFVLYLTSALTVSALLFLQLGRVKD